MTIGKSIWEDLPYSERFRLMRVFDVGARRRQVQMGKRLKQVMENNEN